MALDTVSFNELLNLIIYDTISESDTLMDTSSQSPPPLCLDHQLGCPSNSIDSTVMMNMQHCPSATAKKANHNHNHNHNQHQLGAQPQGRKKRRRRPRVCKNKEEAETQRMTHIAVERNRRKQMNEHLAILKSLMPESYVQRGDQASIVGGAIEFVKELEHLLQSLEAQKLHHKQLITEEEAESHQTSPLTPAPALAPEAEDSKLLMERPFSQFFTYPQYTWSQLPNSHNNKYNAASGSSSSTAAMADIEVTLIETHANMRILSRRSPRQLSRLVAGFHTLQLSILHLNVTTVHPLVLYSISAKVEEGCQLTTVDDIAGAVHHMLIIIEEGEADRGGNYLC